MPCGLGGRGAGSGNSPAPPSGAVPGFPPPREVAPSWPQSWWLSLLGGETGVPAAAPSRLRPAPDLHKLRLGPSHPARSPCVTWPLGSRLPVPLLFQTLLGLLTHPELTSSKEVSLPRPDSSLRNSPADGERPHSHLPGTRISPGSCDFPFVTVTCDRKGEMLFSVRGCSATRSSEPRAPGAPQARPPVSFHSLRKGLPQEFTGQRGRSQTSGGSLADSWLTPSSHPSRRRAPSPVWSVPQLQTWVLSRRGLLLT